MLFHYRSCDRLRSAFDVCLDNGTTTQSLQRNIESRCRSERRKCCDGYLRSGDSDLRDLSFTISVQATITTSRHLFRWHHVCSSFHKIVKRQLSSGILRACGVSLGRLIVYARNVNSLDILWVAGLVTSFRYVSALSPQNPS